MRDTGHEGLSPRGVSMKKRSTAKRTKNARARKAASTRKPAAAEVKAKASSSKGTRVSGGVRKAKPMAQPKAKAKARSRATAPRRPGAAGARTLIVVTSGDRPVQEIAGELTGAGFVVDQVLEHIGQVTGRASAAVMRRVKGIRGVTDVSPEHPPFDIGPPDAPVS
jgi:hypothetical protein